MQPLLSRRIPEEVVFLVALIADKQNSWAREGSVWREMDAKDVRIFCQMAFKYTNYNAFSQRRISPTEIARLLELPERTVRLRIRRMEREGFIKYYQAIPNFSLFNMGLSLFGFEAKDTNSKHELLEKFRNEPRVVEILDYMGPIFAATLAGESPEESARYAQKLGRRFRLKGTVKLSYSKSQSPTLVPTKLDWKIIRALRSNALRSSAEVANSAAASRRMVEYRISKLLDGRVFFVKAMIDAKKQRGIIFYVLTLFTDPGEKAKIPEALRQLHGEKLWTMFAPEDDLFIVNLFGFSSGEPEDSLIQTLKLPGVREGQLSILREWLEPDQPSWIDNLIQVRGDIEPQSKER